MVPKITLLIPCYNEAVILKRKIKNCLELSYPQIKEIVVIDDFSSDKTAQIARALARENPKITFLSNRFKKGKTGAVLTGIKHAKTDLICLSDVDVLLEKGSLEKMASFFQDPKIGIVGGALKPVFFNPETKQYLDGRGLWDKAFDQIKTIISKIDSLPLQHGQFIIIKKSLGVFPQAGVQADDIDLAIRTRLKGFRSVLAPESFFWQEITDKNDFGKRSRRDQGTIKILWHYKNLLFNPRLGKFGLICYPACFFLFFLQPFLFFLLAILIFLALPLPLMLVYLLAIFSITFLRNFFYFNLITILSMIKVLFFKGKIADSWDTQRVDKK